MAEEDQPLESERGERKANQPKTRDVELWMKKGNEKSKENEEEQECLPQFTEKKKEEFVFKMAKANFNEVRMTNFLLACLKEIRRGEIYLNP